MLKFRLLLAFFLVLVTCCRSGGSAGFARYAGEGAAGENGYITFYSQGLKLRAKTQQPGKLRAFLLAAMATPDLALACAAWDCAAPTLKTLSSAQRSPLFGYALWHLADLATQQNHSGEALDLLALVDGDLPQPFGRKISLLRGRLLQLTHAPAADAARHWQRHAEKFADAESLYLAANGLDQAGEKKAAQELAWRALEKPEADFPFAQSGILLRNLLGQGVYAAGDDRQRIRLMEALRVAKDRQTALRLYQKLASAKFSDEDKLLFTQYSARLLAEKGDFAALAKIVAAAGAEFFSEANEKPALDICERLLKKKQFGLVAALYPKNPPTKAGLQCRLRQAQRSSDYSPAARALAAQYLTDFDAESTLAERIFLRSCLPVGKHGRGRVDADCLEELRRTTQGKPTGAGARYFLARHYDAAGATEHVRTLLSEIAANYSDDYYFYRLTERPLKAQKVWAAEFSANNTREGKLLAALLTTDLFRAKDLGENPQLAGLMGEVTKLGGDLDHNRRMALLLLAADSRDEMRELLRGEEKPQIYKTLIALGVVAQKSDIALYGVKQFIRDRKLRPFLFEVPGQLRELLYPTTYSATIEKYAAKNRLEVAEVLALIRQESQFFPGALSIANAQGLMQILPATAKLVAVREGMTHYNLLKAEDNIRLGTGFMRDIKDFYAADFTGLAIAYNAGPGRLKQWKKKYSEDDDIFVEEIPFQETYHYVRVLLADRARYRVLLENK